jgi:hypothetical protein
MPLPAVVPAVQQPSGQDVALQRHTPPWQYWPGPHGPPLPQPHERGGVSWQLSVWPVHGEHAPPPGPPQCAMSVPLKHWSFSQQPLGQLVESHLHVPLTQRWPAAQVTPPHWHVPALQVSGLTHAMHELPASPQVPFDEAKQVPPLQQPVEQLVESHPVHAWLLQVLPDAVHA